MFTTTLVDAAMRLILAGSDVLASRISMLCTRCLSMPVRLFSTPSSLERLRPAIAMRGCWGCCARYCTTRLPVNPEPPYTTTSNLGTLIVDEKDRSVHSKVFAAHGKTVGRTGYNMPYLGLFPILHIKAYFYTV